MRLLFIVLGLFITNIIYYFFNKDNKLFKFILFNIMNSLLLACFMNKELIILFKVFINIILFNYIIIKDFESYEVNIKYINIFIILLIILNIFTIDIHLNIIYIMISILLYFISFKNIKWYMGKVDILLFIFSIFNMGIYFLLVFILSILLSFPFSFYSYYKNNNALLAYGPFILLSNLIILFIGV